jgi:hypothetical protein
MILALSMTATAAAAVNFHSEVEPTGLTGEAEGLQRFFTIHDKAEITCGKLSVEGTVVPKTASEFELVPTFSECSFGGVAATVKMNGCKFKVTTTTVAGEHFQTAIVCPVGAKTEISSLAFPCPYKIGPQVKFGATITNKGFGASRDLLIKFTMAGMSYERTCLGFMGEDLSFSASVTVKGFVDKGGVHGSQVGIWIE